MAGGEIVSWEIAYSTCQEAECLEWKYEAGPVTPEPGPWDRDDPKKKLTVIYDQDESRWDSCDCEFRSDDYLGVRSTLV